MARSFPGLGHRYDVIVVGAGVAGCEAALAAARRGCDVLLVTTSLDTAYLLTYQRQRVEPPPGTLMAELCRDLQDGDGAVDRWELHRRAKYVIESQAGLHLLQSNVSALMVERGSVTGVTTWEGVERHGGAVALCVGPFLGARLRQGRLRENAGRLGEMAYDELFRDLEAHGFAFDSLLLRAEPPGAPAYSVRCRTFAAAERGRGHALRRLDGLLGGGLCLLGSLSHEEAAADGLSLGTELAEALGPQSGGRAAQ